MELRHQHKNDRDVVGEEKTRREPELEQPRWPGKRTLTQAGHAEVDARTPDLRRIRAALGSLRSGGQALPGEMTAQYSQLLGLDLSDVRIHRGGAAKSLAATAFTAGTNIAIADHLDVESAFGRHVIAHELVHVAQNKRSGAPMGLAAHMEIGPSGSAVEQEAERGAVALTRGESFTVQVHGRLPGISRFSDDETPPPGAGSAPTTLPNCTPAPTKPDNTPTPTTQPTNVQPAAPPAAPAPPATAAPAVQPRPTDQPTNTPQAPATPAPGTSGHDQPSGSAPATNPTTLPNREPRPSATPQATPMPAATLDARVQQELETRADPTLKAGYARAVAGVDSLRIQALQYSFTPNGVWNTLVETFTAKNAFQDHFGQIYSTNAYRGGTSWADTAQAWIEGLRGVVHIIGDVASVVSAWAGLAALVTGALALILSETVIGGIALGAIAAIAAEIALVAGAIKLLTDIIDTLLGIIQMIILIVRARNSKDPAARARFAALLHKEANDFGANVISIGVQVAVMAVSAGIGAGMSRGANSFMSAFKSEFSKMITPALKPWTLGNNFRSIAKMMAPVAPGSGVAARGNNLLGKPTGRTVLQVELDQGLVGINRNLRVGSRITRAREVIPFTARNQMNGARLVTMRTAVARAMVVNTGGVKVALGGSQLQADIKQPRGSNGGTSSSSPAGGGGRINAPSAASGADLSKVQMWPSQIEAFEAAKGPLQGAVDRTQRQYDMAESQAGPALAAQVRQAMQGATNSAGQMRFGATQVQTDAREGQANTQRGIQQSTQARTQQTRMGTTQSSANASVQRIQGQGGKLQSPPPKEGVLGWLYNQTIGRIGGWIGSAQKWVMNLVGKWAMSLAGFSKEEMDIAGIENDMRADDKKDEQSSQDAQDAALKADQVQQTVFTLQENKTRDEQYAIQAMADAQRFIQSLEDADQQLGAAITNGRSYIAAVTPVLAHELQTESTGSAIDAQYVAPLVAYATAFTDSIDGSNIGSSARTDGAGALGQMKAAYPELDIGPGTTAIGAAVAQYDTAFGQLSGQARGQVAAMQTAIQAFVGTQDYDGVGGNASALDALAADFDRSAQALADQLYAAINSTITQYNGHIQRAIDEANATPDEPAADSAAPPPAADPPPTTSDADASSGFAGGYAQNRQGVAPNPTTLSETKAPIADNAAKPATNDAAKADQDATPPTPPTATAEKADAGAGTKPSANDGTPAKDDPAKASAVDKPHSDAPATPAGAKPFGTAKQTASKSEADKTDADKLDLGEPAPSLEAGGDAGAEPTSQPSPKTGARPISTKPQETPIEQPMTSAVADTSSNASAKPKTEKTEKKPPDRKTDTGGGRSTSESVAPVQEDDESEGDDAEGDVQGYGTGHAESGYAAGEGQPGIEGTPGERANGGTNAGSVTHQTEVDDGRAADRTTIGVGERIDFTADQAGAWSASASGPGGRATANAASYQWTAPATAGSSTISFTPSGGTAQTFAFTVIAPSGVDFESPQEKSYTDGTQGVGMITNVRFQPNTVSFHRTKWKEIAGPASNKSGYFENRRVLDHAPNPRWLQIGSDNGGPTDDAFFHSWRSPWSEGGFDWVIPNHYRVDGESGAGHEITQITQACAIQGDGTSTITKGTASATRSPGTAPARRGGRGRGRGRGFAGGFGSSRGAAPAASPVEVATRATEGSGSALPHLAQVQTSFGRHDVSNVRSHHDTTAQTAADALGAQAFAVGDAVAFKGTADLHTTAHEAAHVVQQRAGLRPPGDMDTGPNDALERHADTVADAVVQGRSAQPLLDKVAGSSKGAAQPAVQRRVPVNPVRAVRHDRLALVGDGTPANPGLIVSALETYVAAQADWFSEASLTQADRDLVWKVLLLVGEGSHFSTALGPLRVAEVANAPAPNLAKLRAYASCFDSGAETIQLNTAAPTMARALKIGEAVTALGGFVPSAVGRVVIPEAGLIYLIDNSKIPELQRYYTMFHPTLEAQEEWQYVQELLDEGVAGYAALAPFVKDLHIFTIATRQKLLTNIADRTRSKPVMLVLFSGSDWNTAFLQAQNLEANILDAHNLAIVIQGPTSIAAATGEVTRIADTYGQIPSPGARPRLGQVVIAGHGSDQSVEMANTGANPTMRDDKRSVAYDEESVDSSNPTANGTEAMIDTILDRMDPAAARVVFAGCLVGSHNIPASTDVSNPGTAQGNIQAAIRANPNLSDYVRERMRLKGITGEVHAANASTTFGAWNLDAAGQSQLAIPGFDPHVSGTKLQYLQTGVEPEGAMRAAIECVADLGLPTTSGHVHTRIASLAGVTEWWASMTRMGFEMVTPNPAPADLDLSKLMDISHRIEAWFFCGWAEMIPVQRAANTCRNRTEADKVFGTMLTTDTAAEDFLKVGANEAWMKFDPSKATAFMAALTASALTRRTFEPLLARNLVGPKLTTLLGGGTFTRGQMLLAITIAVADGEGMPLQVRNFLRAAAGGSRTTTFPAARDFAGLADGANELEVLRHIGLAPGAADNTASATPVDGNVDVDGNGMNETVVTVEPHEATVNVRTTLNVRARGNMSGTILDQLNPGDVVRVMGERGAWSLVDHNGQIGFVATRYLAR